MQYLDYNEDRQRGTYGFPFEFHHLDEQHPQYVMPYHWHVEYELIRILTGSIVVRLDEREFAAYAGDALFIGGGTLHAGIPGEGCVYECIVFDLNTFIKQFEPCKKFIQQITDQSILVHHYFPSENLEIHEIVRELFDALSAREEGCELKAVGGFYRFFGAICEKRLYLTDARQTPRDHKRILQLKSVLEYIESAYGSPITLEKLSRIVNMSPKYFCRFFQEMTHKTPIDYVNSYRIEAACHELLTTDQSVTEIALNSGFNDTSYFIRMFKKYKGSTPKRYLRQ